MENKLPVIGQAVTDHSADALVDNKFKKVKISDYAGKWLVLFFYPADFTFVCPTELEELADNYDEFKKLDVEVLSISTDTQFVHKAWHDHSPAIKKIKFPMLADPTGKMAKDFGVYIEAEGLALRGTFIIDPDGKLVGTEVIDNSIGRNTKELLRKIQAAQYVRSHQGEVCPASWQPGSKTLTPNEDLVGKI
ncbi:MAG: peroxiredoxin [Candidatus Magasanikbacteria bacterium RIFOXYC2_FULL_42_28]|uniref:Alkyl hydroperoxide reductase C n=1 Tax=Candidatus Magasanikbacteria bacterium RIFOXYC2_FULL_42_28 TaxID=1798704 RepID=A0A1F6NVV2_9BACT|nr:MAG: peroxiredoxin [Candidatus Magasanikbacteria bacterium RIFOXYC2_FULL_42_28]